ncbi:hypothetical protein [Desulfoferrobacter suflitae]
MEFGYDIRTVQELLGHQDGRTAMVYSHVQVWRITILTQKARRLRMP